MGQQHLKKIDRTISINHNCNCLLFYRVLNQIQTYKQKETKRGKTQKNEEQTNREKIKKGKEKEKRDRKGEKKQKEKKD